MPDPQQLNDPDQLALFPLADKGNQTKQPTLDALIQAARVEAAKKSDGGAVGAVVERLAATDGHAPVEMLRAEGFPDHAIAAACSTDEADKRRKPRANLGIVGGAPYLWLTTTGWQSAGKTSRRERSPSAESAEHAAAPLDLSRWLRERLAPWPHLRVGVVTGEPCRAWSERVKALAWSRISSGAGDATGSYGMLTGGLVPDALIVTRWPSWDIYRSAWGENPATPEDAAEETCTLEFEASRKGSGTGSDAGGPLRWKVERNEAALDLGAAHAVVWVVPDRQVAEDLQALGVGRRGSRQLLVPAHLVGLGGDEMPDYEPVWWPLRLGADQ